MVWCRVFGGGGARSLVCPVQGHACAWLWLLSWLVVLGAGLVAGAVAGQGGPVAGPAGVLRRRLRVLGGSPAAARRALSFCRAFQAQDALVADDQQGGGEQH